MRQATIAAMPNAHSHAFQRDLRGLGERTPDDFWSWRTQMLHLAQALDPEAMHRVASQVYSEMLTAGYGGPVAGALIFWFFLNGLDLFFDKATDDNIIVSALAGASAAFEPAWHL